jgi:hypothetical protein
MKILPLFLICTLGAICVAPGVARAQEGADYAARLNARQELELAKIELRHYWQVEYPRQQRHLNAAIQLTDAEIRDYRARLREYAPFTRFSTGQPFLITLQDLRMCLREAEFRQRELWAERNALVRFHSDQWRMLEMRVHAARLRVAELEANDAERDTAEPLAQQ